MANVYDAIIIGGGHNGLTSGRVLRPRGRPDRGARGPEQDRRRRRHERAVRGPPRDQRHDLLVRDVADAADDHPRAEAEAATATTSRRSARTTRPTPTVASITVYADDAAKSYDSIAQFSKKDADTLPKWEAWLQGVADVLGPAAAAGAAARSARWRSATCSTSAQAAWKMRKLGVRGVGDVTRLFTMSVTRPARRLVRVRRDQGHAHGERRDRHVGRPGRARHRVRDAAPLDRRRRRRPPRVVGVPAGRDGRASRDSIRRSAESFGCEIRTDARVQKILVRGGRVVGVVARERRGAPRAGRA